MKHLRVLGRAALSAAGCYDISSNFIREAQRTGRVSGGTHDRERISNRLEISAVEAIGEVRRGARHGENSICVRLTAVLRFCCRKAASE